MGVSSYCFSDSIFLAVLDGDVEDVVCGIEGRVFRVKGRKETLQAVLGSCVRGGVPFVLQEDVLWSSVDCRGLGEVCFGLGHVGSFGVEGGPSFSNFIRDF